MRACVRAPRSSDDTSGRSQPCGDANQLAEDKTHGHHPQSHREMGMDALTLANLGRQNQKPFGFYLLKVATVVTVSMYSWWRHF